MPRDHPGISRSAMRQSPTRNPAEPVPIHSQGTPPATAFGAPCRLHGVDGHPDAAAATG